ncbi:hypothetical protein A2U01_0056060, partial [Trifolium medium]|nr:hypothetical protein [Trifolium medium]
NAIINTTNEPTGNGENSASETNSSTNQLTTSDSFNDDGDDSQPMAIEDSAQGLDSITRDNSDDHSDDSTETSQRSTQIESEVRVANEENNTNT